MTGTRIQFKLSYSNVYRRAFYGHFGTISFFEFRCTLSIGSTLAYTAPQLSGDRLEAAEQRTRFPT